MGEQRRTFMRHPFLVGKVVYLRALEKEDLSGNYFQWFNDQEVCRFNAHGRAPNNMESMEAYLKRAYNDPSLAVFAISYLENDAHVGNICLQGINLIDRSAEYAVVLGEKDYWGKGVAKEASDLILQHGFMTLNLHRIHCGTSEENTGMQKLAAYMGMKEEGRRREALFKNGRYFDIVEYGILREEYLSHTQGKGVKNV
jgi:RimJ/RimL family protein N-acetyltransferase